MLKFVIYQCVCHHSLQGFNYRTEKSKYPENYLNLLARQLKAIPTILFALVTLLYTFKLAPCTDVFKTSIFAVIQFCNLFPASMII